MFLKILLLCLALSVINAKKFERCNLARQLLRKYHFPRNQISRWICIIEHESRFNTKALNTNTKDYGLFQISQKYWCDPVLNAKAAGCGVSCSKFRDNNIDDDVKCVKTIFKEFQQRTGNGFKAWSTYDQYCKGNTNKYISKCK